MKKIFLYILIVSMLTVSAFSDSTSIDEANTDEANTVEADAGEAAGFTNAHSEVFSVVPVLSDFLSQRVPETHCQAAYVMNLEDNIEIFEKQKNEKLYPTSTVKLMTAYTAYKLIPDLDTVVTASETAVKASRGLNIKIVAGESYKARDLLYAMLVGGANDAANVLAEFSAGSIDEFVKKMNDNAVIMGAVDTVYTNPTGLHDDNMTTTAYDTALVAKNLYYINTLTEMTNSVSHEFNCVNVPDKTVVVKTKNRLLAYNYGVNYYNPNAKGLNSGSTDVGGHCLVTTFAKGGLTYLCVVMNCPEIDNPEDEKEPLITSYLDADELISLCIGSFSKQILLKKSAPIYELPIKNSATYDHVILYPYEEIELFLPNELDMKSISFVPTVDKAFALSPINRGDKFGYVSVMYNGNVCLYKTELIADTDIERSNVLYILYKIEAFIKSKLFIALVIIAAILLAAYFGLAIYVNRRAKKRGYRRKP